MLDGEKLEQALLFKKLATLVADAELFDHVEALRWRGATPAFASIADRTGINRLARRVEDLVHRRETGRA